MTRSEQDQMMLKWKKILDDLGIPFYLNQSNCLAIYRDGKNFDENRSIDLAVLAEDLTTEKLNRLILDGYIFSENSHMDEIKRGLMYFEEAKVELQPVYFTNGKAFYNLNGPECVWWPEEYLLKENWEKIKYLDIEWNIPGQTDKYLAHTYGEDWRTPRKEWYWANDAKNVVKFKDL